MLGDFIDALNPARVGVTIIAALVFGFAALGAILSTPSVAKALGDVYYGRTVAKAVFLVAMMFTVPQLILAFVGLDGPPGRVIGGGILWGLFAVCLEAGIRLRIRWVVWRGSQQKGAHNGTTHTA